MYYNLDFNNGDLPPEVMIHAFHLTLMIKQLGDASSGTIFIWS